MPALPVWVAIAIAIAAALLGTGIKAKAATTYETVTGTVVVTNAAAVSNTIALSGLTFTFTNTPASSSFIATTNTAAATGTNVQAALAARLSELTNVNQVTLTNATNVVVEGIFGMPLTITVAGGWGYVTYATNQTYDGKSVVYPWPDAVSPTETTNQAGAVIDMVSFSGATNRVATTAPAMANFVNTSTNAQNITNKVFWNGRFLGDLSGAYVSTGGTLWLTGTVYMASVTNAGRIWEFSVSPTASNHVMTYYDVTGVIPTLDTNTFRRDTDVDPHVWYMRTNGWMPPMIYNAGVFTNSFDLEFGSFIRLHTNAAILSWDEAAEYYFPSAAMGFDDGSVMTYGFFNKSQFAYNPTNYESMSIKDGALVTNLVHRGKFWSHGLMAHVPVTVSSLSAGNNIVTRATPGTDMANVVRFGATAGVATIAAIAAAAGDGDWFIGINGTGYDLILTNESGFTAVATNRLRLPESMTGMRIPPDGQFRAVFDVTVSSGRWRVDGGISTNFNAIAQSSGVGTNTTLTMPTLKGTNVTALVVTDVGRVGVGTNAPQAQLHVHGTLRFDGPGSGSPTNSTNVVLWIPLNVNGTNGFVPFYQ
jgi:hypothetical protein